MQMLLSVVCKCCFRLYATLRSVVCHGHTCSRIDAPMSETNSSGRPWSAHNTRPNASGSSDESVSHRNWSAHAMRTELVQRFGHTRARRAVSADARDRRRARWQHTEGTLQAEISDTEMQVHDTQRAVGCSLSSARRYQRLVSANSCAVLQEQRLRIAQSRAGVNHTMASVDPKRHQSAAARRRRPWCGSGRPRERAV